MRQGFPWLIVTASNCPASKRQFKLEVEGLNLIFQRLTSIERFRTNHRSWSRRIGEPRNIHWNGSLYFYSSRRKRKSRKWKSKIYR